MYLQLSTNVTLDKVGDSVLTSVAVFSLPEIGTFTEINPIPGDTLAIVQAGRV